MIILALIYISKILFGGVRKFPLSATTVLESATFTIYLASHKFQEPPAWINKG